MADNACLSRPQYGLADDPHTTESRLQFLPGL